MTNKNAKYRVKNAEGEYEVVHLETNVDQVIETEEKQFVSEAKKAQYDEKLIEHLNGFCLAEFVELTRGEVNEAIKSAFNIIRSVGITEYSSLLDFLEDNGLGDEWDVVRNNVILFNTYLTSRRWTEQKNAESLGRIALARERAQKSPVT